MERKNGQKLHFDTFPLISKALTILKFLFRKSTIKASWTLRSYVRFTPILYIFSKFSKMHTHLYIILPKK